MPLRKFRKRNVRRRIRRQRVGRNVLSQANVSKVHNFQYVNVLQISNTTGGAGGAITWKLNDITSYTELTALYGMYKINKIVMKWLPYVSEVTMTGTQTLLDQLMYIAFDPANNSAGTFAALIQYPRCMVKSVTKPFSLVIKPSVLDALGTASTTSPVPSSKVWIPTGNATNPMYALRYYIPDTGQANAQGVGVWVMRYFISCKDQQ